MADFIAWKAGNDQSITVGDDGSVIGLDALAERTLGAFPRPAAPAQAVSPVPTAPALAPPSSPEPPDPKWSGLKVMADLVKMGPMAVHEYQTKHPEKFAELQNRRR